jgi:hypothetical protein
MKYLFGMFVASAIGLAMAWSFVSSLRSGEIRMCAHRSHDCVTHTWDKEPLTFLSGLLFPALGCFVCLVVLVVLMRERRS